MLACLFGNDAVMTTIKSGVSKEFGTPQNLFLLYVALKRSLLCQQQP